MKFLSLSVATLIVRFYLVMAICIIAGFSGLWFLAILALPVFFSALLGMEFKSHHSIKKPAMAKGLNEVGHQHHPAH